MVERRGAGAPGGLVARLPTAVILLLAWLFPGVVHVATGRRGRALVFALVVVTGFAVGIVLGGELFVPDPADPLSYLATIASAGNGILYFVARAMGLGRGIVTAVSYEYGNTFLLTSGMMNLLLVLDVHDIVTGRKDW